MKRTKTYQKVLDMLNPEQRMAVESIEGPMLVLAGPGTGKTQILGARIGRILEQTDTSPQQILCLTYTEAGVVAMRKRLNTFIGPTAYNVPIHTFHSFCNMVIQENRDYFMKSLDLNHASDLDQFRMMKQLIDAWEADFPLKNSKYPYVIINRLLKLYSYMKRENETPDSLRLKIDKQIKDIKDDIFIIDDTPSNISSSGKSKGNLKVDAKKYIASLEKTKLASSTFKQYENLKAKLGLYDYDDMISWVYESFSENEDMLLSYQERYLYILIDEFQDNNGIQAEIAYQLADFWERPNIFVVGDDDQSIFRFQGANFENILNFMNSYMDAGLEMVVLRNNYRSVPGILEASTELIEQNLGRMVLQDERLKKDLIAAHPSYTQGLEKPLIVACKNPQEQLAILVKKIKNLQDKGTALAEIAILYRQHKHANDLQKLFNHYNIPFDTRRKEDALEHPIIKALLDHLEYIHLESEEPFDHDRALFKMMHFPWNGFRSSDISLIWTHWKSEKSKNKTNLPFKAWIQNDWKDSENLNIAEDTGIQIIQFCETLDELSSKYFTETLQVFIEKVYRQTGLLDYILNASEKRYYLQVLSSFMNWIKEASDRKHNFSVEDMLSMIDEMREHKIEIPVHRHIAHQEGVQMMTLHASKGLEFEHVFILNGTAKAWEKKKRTSQGFKLPIEQENINEKDILREEMRRLLFVGCTRAKRHLYLMFPQQDDQGEEQEPSQFYEEIKQSPSVEYIESKNISEQELTKQAEILFKVSNKVHEELLDEEWLNYLLDNFSLSPTSLNKYLECPLRFFYENLLRIPSARNAHLGFGNAIHYALEKFLASFKLNELKQNSTDTLIDFFNKGMDKYHSHFTDQEFKDWTAYGESILRSYALEKRKHWDQIPKFETEYKVSTAEWQGIPINGQIDKIEFYKDQITVVDYKTGKAQKAKVKAPEKVEENYQKYVAEEDPENKDKLRLKYQGTDYWRQLVFYKMLIESDKQRNWKVSSGIMDFIEPEKKSNGDEIHLEVKVAISSKDMQTVSEQLKEAWFGIQNKEFSRMCGKKNCEWCQMNLGKENLKPKES
jgi:DNA helicase-2/ATP-dependent DNA helicase PcrA